MSWQDELRQLDEDLAAGKVSAQEYRSRRDALLMQTAGAAPAPEPPPQAPPPQQSGPWTPAPQQPGQRQPGQQPPQPQPQYAPFPPLPGQPRPTPPPGMPAEHTQVIFGAQPPPPGSMESTQIVRPVGPPNASDDNPETTQVVPGIGGRAGGQWSAQSPQAADNQTPWGGGEFPPLSSLRPNEPWYTPQGPEVFHRRDGARGKILAIVGGVVVIGLVAAAILVFKPFSGGGGHQTTAQSPRTTRPSPTSATPTGPIAHIPGSTAPNSVRTFADVSSLGIRTQEEITAYQAGQPTDAYFSDTRSGQNRVLILVVKTSDQQAAGSIATQLSQLEVKYSMTARTGGPVGVQIQATDSAQGGALRRAEYASGSDVLRIQVQGQDATGADQELTAVLNAQLSRLPAND